jgi:hypothetical protein
MASEKEAQIHMLHIATGQAGVVPESRVEEAKKSGFELAAAMRDPETGELKYVGHSQVAAHQKAGFKHLYQPEKAETAKKDKPIKKLEPEWGLENNAVLTGRKSK